jgi:putative cardiolipin synthase
VAKRLLAAGFAALAWGCASLPALDGRPDTRALGGTAGTRIGSAVAPLAAAHPGKTGIHLLPHGTDAFAARMVLAAAAQRSIDAQYYIWHGDQTGVLLFEALTQAARRGVRVRILLDDQTSRDNEEIVAGLGAEPHIEVRYYNPFAQRRARFLDYLGDFARVNRRMHNKAFVVDNQAAVVGGRNIGNEYFGAGTEVPFVDLDVLAVGAAVPEVSAQFDLYWNSASAYPARLLVGEATPDARAALEARFAATRADGHSRAYLETARDTPLLAALLRRELSLEWASARVVTDDPAKTLDRTERTDVLLLSRLTAGATRSTFDLVSPYFVPGEKGSAYLEGLARSGVRVRVLTNSFAATDVSVVHAGYAKRREGLAAAGVRLFELKGTGQPAERDERGRSRSGSSPSSLHAKTFAADGERIFVGSFNFDPRSALLNTELGLVIESPAIAGRLSAAFDTWVPERAYEVRMRSDGALEWIERLPSGEVRHATEPGVGGVRSGWLGFLSLLPIDWLL